MDVRAISRAALSSYLTLVRMPLDLAVRARGRSAATSPTKRSLDRAEAAVRDVAGWAIGDEQLRDDAQRRRIVAQRVRGRPAPLGGEAQRLSEEGREIMRRRREAAAQRRAQAAKREKARKRHEAREKLEQLRRANAEKPSARAESDAADAGRVERAPEPARPQDKVAATRNAQRLRRAGRANAPPKPPR